MVNFVSFSDFFCGRKREISLVTCYMYVCALLLLMASYLTEQMNNYFIREIKLEVVLCIENMLFAVVIFYLLSSFIFVNSLNVGKHPTAGTSELLGIVL